MNQDYQSIVFYVQKEEEERSTHSTEQNFTDNIGEDNLNYHCTMDVTVNIAEMKDGLDSSPWLRPHRTVILKREMC